MPRSIQSSEHPSTFAIATAVEVVIGARGFFSSRDTCVSLANPATRLSSRALIPTDSRSFRIRLATIAATLPLTYALVNDLGDGHLSRCAPWDDQAVDVVEGMRERIQHLAEALGSERELARRAKLQSESHLSLILSGRTNDPRIRTLVKIAEGAKVSLCYLLTGRSDRALELGIDPTKHPQSSFPSAAYALLELYRYDEVVVKVVQDAIAERRDRDRPLSTDEWFDGMRGEYTRRRQGLTFTARG